jgi:hypothetical protein
MVDLPGAGGPSAHRYLSIWETGTNDAASATGKLDMTRAIDPGGLIQWFEAVEE